MGISDLFGKKKKEEFDPLRDLVLSKLKVGYMLDYDLKTWEVTGYNRYDWGEGEYSEEWELQSGGEIIYLEREEDDGNLIWTVSRKIPISRIEKSVIDQIKEKEDPPEDIIFEGRKYYLSESGAGYLLKGGTGSKKGFIFWDFLDDSEKRILTIEQWGDNEFELSNGEYVDEYQFTNILPGGEI